MHLMHSCMRIASAARARLVYLSTFSRVLASFIRPPRDWALWCTSQGRICRSAEIDRATRGPRELVNANRTRARAPSLYVYIYIYANERACQRRNEGTARRRCINNARRNGILRLQDERSSLSQIEGEMLLVCLRRFFSMFRRGGFVVEFFYYLCWVELNFCAW